MQKSTQVCISFFKTFQGEHAPGPPLALQTSTLCPDLALRVVDLTPRGLNIFVCHCYNISIPSDQVLPLVKERGGSLYSATASLHNLHIL